MRSQPNAYEVVSDSSPDAKGSAVHVAKGTAGFVYYGFPLHARLKGDADLEGAIFHGIEFDQDWTTAVQ
jgi:hypothetical protein